MACSARRFAVGVFLFLTVAFAAAASAQPVAPTPVPGRNVNLSSGPAELNTSVTPPIIRGDFLLKQQNEGSCGMSARNPKNILCAGNDYRLIDVPGVDPGDATRDAWTGIYQSTDGGDTWESTVFRGHYLDPDQTAPLKPYHAMADPVVRSGPAGLAYISGIAFKGPDGSGIVYLATLLDLNNKENDRQPFKQVRFTTLDTGTQGQFIDKPWMVVLPPGGTATCTMTLPKEDGTGTITQVVPDSTVIVGYSIFVGQQPDPDLIRTKQYIARVTGCGATVERRVKISESQRVNQATTVAASPVSGSQRVVAAWRRYEGGTETDAMLVSVSNDRGLTWSKATVAAGPICPFEQASTGMSFRVHTFPTLTAGADGTFYLAWSDRGKSGGACSTTAPARIVVSSSSDGVTWTAPVPVDTGVNAGHQVNPSLTSGGGTVHLLWQDIRETASGYFDQYISEYPLLRAALGLTDPPAPGSVPLPVKHHTIDIFSKMASGAGSALTWGPTVRVSQYKNGAWLDKNTMQYVYGQAQWNIPNLRMFSRAKKAFNGDYVDAAIPPMLPPDPAAGRTNWSPNIGQAGDPVFFAVWTDNRDVRRAPGQADDTDTQAVPYTPPGRTGTSLADPTQQCPVCVPGTNDYTGTMNQNLYGARIDRGFFAYSPGNNKQVSTFQRAYVISVRNDGDATRTFRLYIPPAFQNPTGGQVAFNQRVQGVPFVPEYELLVDVPKHSTASRSVFIIPDPSGGLPLDPRTMVRVEVEQVVTGQTQAVYINGDPTAPEIEAPEIEAPEIEATEVYTPEIEAPEIEAPEIEAPEIEAPEIEAPEIEAPEIEAPEIEAASYQTPEIEAPEIEAPEIEAPEIEAPEIEANAPAITDITWPVKNSGNTTAGYFVRPLVSGNVDGYHFELIVSRIVKTPAALSCQPAQSVMNRVSLDIVDANNLVNPNYVLTDQEIANATIWVNPLEEHVLITLRVRGATAFDPVTHPTVVTVTQQAINTADLAGGVTEPPTYVASAVPGVRFASAPTGVVSTRVISPAVQVQVSDSTGGVVPGAAVTIALGSAPAGAALSGTTTVFSDAMGVATFSNLVITGAGEGFTLVASAPGATAATTEPFIVLEACAADGIAAIVPSTIDSPGAAGPLLARDANFDGNIYRDLMVVHDNGVVLKMNGTGRGVFGRAFQFTIEGLSQPTDGAVADLNRDGYDDILVTYPNANRLGVAIGNAPGAVFGVQRTYTIDLAAAPYAVATGDFNRDGNPDAVVALTDNDHVAVLLGDGSGTFGAPIMLPTVGPNAVATADFNGDGFADVVAAGRAEVAIYLGSSTGEFLAGGTRPAGAPMIAVTTGDFNHDGMLDVATAAYVAPPSLVTNNIAVFEGDGRGGLTLLTRADPLRAGLTSLTAGDLDADGDTDLVVTGAFDGQFAVLFNDGTGLFPDVRFFTAGTDPIDVWTAEVTNDSRMDLIITNSGADPFGNDTVSTMIGSCGALTADMSVTSTVAPQPAHFGDTVNWTMLVTNNGPFTATGAHAIGTAAVSATDQGYDSLVAITPGCEITGGGGFDCTLGSMAPGATLTVELQLTGVRVGVIRAIVNAMSDLLDKVPANTRSVTSISVEAAPMMFAVTTTADSGSGSLRQAILNANQNAPAADTIVFNIPGGGVHTISPVTALPIITDQIVIDGSTQPGSACGAPAIELEGSAAGAGASGLDIRGGNSIVRALAINRWNISGIRLTTAGNNGVYGNLIGIDPTGTTARPNGRNGVDIGSTANTIGGSTLCDRNLLSGNSGYGVQITGASSDGNTVAGNFIGTNGNGTAAVGNVTGVYVSNAAKNVVIGPDNVISGNRDGIEVSGGSAARIVGNYVGTNPSGTAALGNTYTGVLVIQPGSGATIGGETIAERNIISSNGFACPGFCSGIDIALDATATIKGNYIGVNAAATMALPNVGRGITVRETGYPVQIGGSTPGAGNVIAGNTWEGIYLTGTSARPTSAVVISGNLIGNNGTTAIANSRGGIHLMDTVVGALIGGSAGNARNIISGNGEFGISLDPSVTDTRVRGNYIGLNAAGNAAIPNTSGGINIASTAHANVVGGTLAAERNVISGNSGPGVRIFFGAYDNAIQGNYIGTDYTGMSAVSIPGPCNICAGISINGSMNNVIGGTVAGAGNVIAGNLGSGVEVGGGTSGTVVAGNVIGLNVASVELPNAVGVILSGTGNIIGGTTPEARNVISGNTMWGISVVLGSDHRILGNYVGTDPTGMLARGNGESGIVIESGSTQNLVGGEVAGARNIISGNTGSGVRIVHATSTGNRVLGNYIGVDVAGDKALPNGREGVRIENGASFNTVGSPSAPNIIAYNGTAGISVTADPAAGTGNVLSGNSIFSNGSTGIDLLGNGITDNDALDGDTGPNNLQNYPVLSLASRDGTAVTVEGSLNSATSNSFTVEVFSSATCDGSGFGEGARLLATALMSTNADGNAAFAIGVGDVPLGSAITATATDSAGNTSEFSRCVSVTAATVGTATVIGTVSDGLGGLLPGVLVTLTNLDTLQMRTAATQADGSFTFSTLPAGNYKIQAPSQPDKFFTLGVGETVTINFP